MRENRTCGSEGGEAQSLPYPYPGGRLLHGRRDACVRAPMMACCQHGVKSVRGLYLDPEIEANCVVARRGGEQAKMNYRTAG